MDVDANNLYFIVDGVIQSCPLSGCSAGPTQLGSFLTAGKLAVANGTLAFQGAPKGAGVSAGMYFCPSTGCPTPNPPVVQNANVRSVVAQGNAIDYVWGFITGSPGLTNLARCESPNGTTCSTQSSQSYPLPQDLNGPLADDGSDLFFSMRTQDGGADIVKCPIGASCASPNAPSVVASGFAATLLAAYGGQVYMTTGSAIIYSCPATGCSSPTSLNTAVVTPTFGLVADQDGVYFTSGTTATGSNEVSVCPLTGCTGTGAHQIARNQPSPSIIRTDSKFVYWVNQGQVGDGSPAFAPGTASIMRVAK
jgi:hypothetical protein